MSNVVEVSHGNVVILVSSYEDRFDLWAYAERIQEIRAAQTLTEYTETHTPKGNVVAKLVFS